MLKAVLFDMDGVIVDSEPMHGETVLLTLQSIEGIKELAEDLRQNGIKLAVASSSSLPYINQVIEKLELLPYFDVLVSGEDVPNPKPGPDVFLKAANALGVEPSECVVIEDSRNGVNAAMNAKMACIALVNPNSGQQDLSNASILLEGFEEVNYGFIETVYKRYHKEPVTIGDSGRLLLRELTKEDIDEICEMYKENNMFDSIQDFISIEDEKEKLLAYIDTVYGLFDYGLWAVIEKESGRFIGECGIQVRDVDGKGFYELEYALRKEFQGLGYASEACEFVLEYLRENLGATEVIAIIPKVNQRSIEFIEKLGFTYWKPYGMKDHIYKAEYRLG